MSHTHATKTTRNMPFDGAVLSICSCGARKCSDNMPIYGAKLDVDGWYVPTPDDDDSYGEAYEMLQTEGHGYDNRDSRDPYDSQMPSID